MFTELKHYMGLGRGTTSAKEKAVAGATGMVAIGLIYFAGLSFGQNAYIFADCFVLIPIAATAVLLFSVPHGALSQPWPVIGGNVVSALVGVVCSNYIHSPLLAASMAVGGAIFFMNYFKCIHPPGGATALTAVLGGDGVKHLGYLFILFPVLFSAVIMVLLAIILNYPFKWRLYPVHLFHLTHTVQRVEPSQRKSEITLEDFIAAVNQHDSYIDITEESWVELFELAKLNAEKEVIHPKEIKVNAFYSNGQLGKDWSVREVLHRTKATAKHAGQVTFQRVAGTTIGNIETCNVEEFRAWAKFQVVKKDSFWQKCG
ncbi:HPP domain-containing protein [Alteromonas pelagimontana]|uniref:HPP domain-containing protein n=1 Tax=Alteromonas pelagimontana TaxID=1858656 RepID=A0A6M4MJ60_9ALTE|nr:HPP family protein [Alteromonas pelagimontana]QJR79317.1 HPP domain-containing protein [Alteromonas pelagimontana]QJR82675.1 HPP domain-containing protein [Alteromonas pelagimontana]